MADGRVYPSDQRQYQVDYSSELSGEMPRPPKYSTSDSSGEMPRHHPPYAKNHNFTSSSEFSGDMRPPRLPPKHHVVQIPKDQVFKTPPPENARLQKIYAARMKNKRNRSCFCIFRYLCSVILILVLVIAIAAGVFYLIYKPTIPKYTLSNLTVKNMNLSSSNTFTFSPEFDATVTAENSNSKIGIDYKGGSDINVYYDNVKFADGSWPEFYQPAKNVTVLVLPIKGSGIKLSVPMRDKMVSDEKNGNVPLNLNMKVPVRIKVAQFSTWTINVFVSCDVSLNTFGAGSKLVSKTCKVKVNGFIKF
ncbi:hypothetical protein LUZ60_010946 [Juncus effusus]|nr:hypothetical protein LUZ60_010946 [Juncus effusus]